MIGIKTTDEYDALMRMIYQKYIEVLKNFNLATMDASLEDVIQRVPITFVDEYKCECGARACGSNIHSDWCEAYE